VELPGSNGGLSVTGVNWSIIDSMSNILGYMHNAINPYAYDPALDILTLVHRGDATSYSASGDLFYSLSTDAGMSWQRSALLNAQDNPRAARFPSGSIFNPTGLQGDAYFFCAYPNLYGDPPSDFGDIGAAYDFPLGGLLATTSHRYAHTDTSQFAIPTQTWASKTHMFWASTMYDTTGISYKGIAIARTTDFIPFPSPVLIPSTGTHKCPASYTSLGGDWIQIGAGGVMAFGFIGQFYRLYHENIDSALVTGLTIGIIYSSDEGVTWSEVDTVNLASLAPDLGVYTHLGEFTASAFDVAGDLLLDSLGYPHVVIGLQEQDDGSAGTNMVIGEIYKTGSGWHGKIVGPLNASTRYDYGEQLGYHPTLARNDQGTVFAVQYIHSNLPSNIPDLWASARKWNANNWSSVFNATETPTRGEAYAHLAPRLRSDSGSLYTMFSTYAYWKVTTHYGNDEDCSPCRTYLYAGQIPVSAQPIIWNNSITWTYPNPGYAITLDSTLCQPTVTIRGGNESDSDWVTFRILSSGGSEIASSGWYIPDVQPGETRLVTWDYCFSPPDTGTYTFQCILNDPLDLFPADDTASIFIHVVVPSPITKSAVRHLPRTYMEITPDITYTYPSGNDDDRQESLQLPFQMSYNGERFDSVQFSTNGWVQLGKSGYGRDTKFGLAHIDEIAYNQNSRGFAALHPVNSFSPWWEDMKLGVADDPSASLGIKTEGTYPTRVFIIQWKNVLAYYDTSTTDVRLNFQARLYESSSVIEFHYGPVSETQISGSDVGAMISLKDETGGDYHFLDVYQNKGGQVRNGNTLLSPLLNWPGPDSMYRILPSYVEIDVPVTSRWNLISYPLLRFDYSVSALIPEISGDVYTYYHGYMASSTLTPGRGYWAKFLGSSSVTMSGHLSESTVLVLDRGGWNLIGSHGVAVPMPTDSCIDANLHTPCYGFHNGYYPATTIEPGRGYWLKTRCPCTIVLRPNAPKTTAVEWNAYNSLRISDHDGNAQSLYFARLPEEPIDPDRYELPPVPPAGIFDARFKSSGILEFFDPANKEEEQTIQIQSAIYPVRVDFNGTDPGMVIDIREGVTGIRHRVSSGQSVYIEDSRVNGFSVSVIGTVSLPMEFALGQNYPNPFNPATITNYQLPTTNHVDIVVYDLLGRNIRTLVHGVVSAGYHTTEWDGRDESGNAVPSGVYFMRMTSGDFSMARKLMLMK
jgi:hypothetical protein